MADRALVGRDGNREVLFAVKIWITDGSGAPFGDVAVLPAAHPGTLGGEVAYKGVPDEGVPVGNAALSADSPADVFIPEAEWCICFPGETGPFIADPDSLTESTPIVMQGMIEGKWLNRFGADLTWRPASLANNLLAQGPGIPGTLGGLESGAMRGEVRVQYECPAGHQTYSSTLEDLRGHNVLGLARAVFGYCREQSLTVEAVDCSARGPASAWAEDRRFLQQLMAAAGVTPADLKGPDAWRRLAPEIAKIASHEGIIVEPGTPVELVVTSGTDTVGRGQLTLLSQ
jgi:hypothetical protein